MSRGTLRGVRALQEGERIAAPSILLYLALLLVGVGLQASLSSQLRLWGGQPDFLLALALCGALLTNAPLGASAGFLSGLMTAAVTGQTMGTYLVSRTIAACVVGGLRKRFIRAGVLVTLLGVGLGSIIAGVLYGLSVPRIGLFQWISMTFIGAAMNMFVALPVAILLRWQSKH
jgi:rod shape-determining protein MreD